MKETIGEFIRQLRKEAGYTLTQLAAKLDMDSANLSKIENGKRDLDERKLEKLSQIFALDLGDLKNEYYSEKFAKKLYKVNCSEKALILAEQKIKYIKQKNARQQNINFRNED